MEPLVYSYHLFASCICCLYVTNVLLNYLMWFCRLQDVGKPKAEVAAMRVMERVSGVNIVPHFCRIEDKDLDFYSQFNIIALGLDSIEARSYINGVVCSFLGVLLRLLFSFV